MPHTKQSTAQLVQAVTPQTLGLASDQHRVSPKIFALLVRVQHQNWRQGTVASKGRSDVARSNKKPWRQKGTGRARAGSARSPLWRGGGITFGPQARVRILKSMKQHRQQTMLALLQDRIRQGAVLSLDWQPAQTPKTSLAANALKQAQLAHKKVLLFLPMQDIAAYASFANIPNVRICYFDEPNVIELAHAPHWVFLNKDLASFKEMVSKWS